jgi:replicative DNA helicase
MSLLPTNTDAERFVLGSILLDDAQYSAAAARLTPDDFSIEKHGVIFRRMGDVAASGSRIDRITLANCLMTNGELEAVNGLTYLVSLDDGLPRIPNLDSYVRIVRDKSILRKIIFASQKIALRAQQDEDPTAILAGAHSDFLDLAQGCAESTLVTPGGIIQAAGGITAYLDRRSKRTGLSTGYAGLDVMTGGLKPGCLYVLAARPKMGKTALAMNIVERVSFPLPTDRRDPKTSAVFSLEMSRGELLDRMICSRSRVNTQRLTGGYMSAEEERAAGHAASEIAADDWLWIEDDARTQTTDIHAKVRRLQANADVALVVVDYLQLMLNCKLAERVAMMSQVSRDCKLIAKDCKVSMLVLSQLSRACETRGSVPGNIDGYRPVPSDIRESGAIEQDADLVMTAFRGEVYVKDHPNLLPDWRGKADLEVILQRSGPTGRIPLTWLAKCVRFEERDISGSEYLGGEN